jgi:hypothetical protein
MNDKSRCLCEAYVISQFLSDRVFAANGSSAVADGQRGQTDRNEIKGEPVSRLALVRGLGVRPSATRMELATITRLKRARQPQ